MYYEEYNPEEEKNQILIERKRKKKQRVTLITLLAIGGLTYYFLVYLSEKRRKVEEEIRKLLETNPSISINSLDSKLWAEKDSWEIYLNNLYLSSQIEKFEKNMKKAINEKVKELENEPGRLRKEKIDAAKDFLEEEEKELLDIKKAFEDFVKKINRTGVDDLSTPTQEFVDLIQEKRDKRKRLYWKLAAHNWSDRWLARSRQSFNSIWGDLKRVNGDKEPGYFDGKAIYKIVFPDSLWNEMSSEQRKLAKLNGHDRLN